MAERTSERVEAGEFKFHVFEPVWPSRREEIPAVRIQKSGEIHVNDVALELIEGAQAVELLYDPQNNALGLRPTDPGNPRAFPRRKENSRRRQHIFAGRGFARFHGIDTSTARRYPAKLVDGILVADLNAGVDVSNRSRSERGEE